MKNKIWDLIVCAAFAAAILSLGIYFLFFYSPRAISITENRTLEQIKPPELKNVLSGEFQGDFEKAVADQTFFRDAALNLNNRKDRIAGFIPRMLIKPTPVAGEIIEIFKDNALYSYEEQLYLLQLPFIYDEELNEEIKAAGERFSLLKEALPHVNVVVFDIEPVFISAASPLNSLYPGAVAGGYSDTLRDSLPEDVLSISRRYENIEEILEEYYRTDHHFNANGAAAVYLQLFYGLSRFSDLGLPIDVSQIEEVPNSEMMGSKARSALYDKISEPLTDIKTDELPQYKIYLNGEDFLRSRRDRVISGEYRKNAEASGGDTRFIPMYAEYFGYDHAEIIYENPDNQNGRTLLLAGTSYTQTFEGLLASHYSKTYVVDPRYFEEELGHDFNVIEYAKSIGADDIVYFTQPQMMADYQWLVR